MSSSPPPSSSLPILSMTPAETGRRARARAFALQSLQSQNEDTTTATNSQEGILSMETLLAHAGVTSSLEEEEQNIPMAPPLHVATTYTRPADGIYRPSDSIYSRHDNPTRLLLEKEMGRLECCIGQGGYSTAGSDSSSSFDSGSCYSCAFASGMMAVSSVILAHTSPLYVLLPHDLYHGVPTVLLDVFPRFQVKTRHVDMTNTRKVQAALSLLLLDDSYSSIRNVIVWMETPSNPLCEIVDIAAICQMVHKEIRNMQQEPLNQFKITTVVDSTLAPPPITQPLLLGADVVLHSATKYLAGHSDATIGVATFSPYTARGRQLGPLLQQVQRSVGGIASPWDCWLTLRGMKTLHLRVVHQSKTALQIAQFLSTQMLITKVHYPGLESHPQHAVAKRQMKHDLFGGMLSLELATEQQAVALAASLTTIQRATSLGGTETLVEHRYSIEPDNRKTSPPGLLRMSVGLEDALDLIADLERALGIVHHLTLSSSSSASTSSSSSSRS